LTNSINRMKVAGIALRSPRAPASKPRRAGARLLGPGGSGNQQPREARAWNGGLGLGGFGVQPRTFANRSRPDRTQGLGLEGQRAGAVTGGWPQQRGKPDPGLRFHRPSTTRRRRSTPVTNSVMGPVGIAVSGATAAKRLPAQAEHQSRGRVTERRGAARLPREFRQKILSRLGAGVPFGRM